LRTFEVLEVVNITIMNFWDVTPYTLVKRYQRLNAPADSIFRVKEEKRSHTDKGAYDHIRRGAATGPSPCLPFSDYCFLHDLHFDPEGESTVFL
jgi:hypothetical protein